MNNIDKPPKHVSHASLKRCSEISLFRSVCPECEAGVLMVRRDHDSFAILNIDRCAACGQQIIYTDEFIAGEPVMDAVKKNVVV